jgi:hypothetical protein
MTIHSSSPEPEPFNLTSEIGSLLPPFRLESAAAANVGQGGHAGLCGEASPEGPSGKDDHCGDERSQHGPEDERPDLMTASSRKEAAATTSAVRGSSISHQENCQEIL